MEEPVRRLGPYRLLGKIGRGAFGVVWLAEKQSSIATTRFALKLPRDEDIDFDAFRREAAIWVQASGHPNVLPLIDADVYDGQAVIVSEYAPDGSLEEWRARHGGRAPSAEAACEIVEGVLAGLEHLHGRRIIHRDLKPDNILLQRDTPRLADFGISRVLRSSSHVTKNISGTFVYMAPEAFDGKRDERTDIWAVGVILYELLAGRLPYDQQDTASLIGAIVRHDPPPLPEGLAPEALRRVVAKALQRDPAERYASAAEMRRDLREAGHRLWLERHEASQRVPETRVAGAAKASDAKTPAPETRLAADAVAAAAESIPASHPETPSTDSGATPEPREGAWAKAIRLTPVSLSKPATWLPVLFWGLVGVVSGLASWGAFQGLVLLTNSYAALLPPGIVFGAALYLFGEYSCAPPIRKRGRVLSYLVLCAATAVGWYSALMLAIAYGLVTRIKIFGGDIWFLTAGAMWGAVFGAFVLAAELLCWRVAPRRFAYAAFTMTAACLSGWTAGYCFALGGVRASLPWFVLFAVWQALVLATHAVAFSRDKKWSTGSVAFMGLIAVAVLTLNTAGKSGDDSSQGGGNQNLSAATNAANVSVTNTQPASPTPTPAPPTSKIVMRFIWSGADFSAPVQKGAVTVSAGGQTFQKNTTSKGWLVLDGVPCNQNAKVVFGRGGLISRKPGEAPFPTEADNNHEAIRYVACSDKPVPVGAFSWEYGDFISDDMDNIDACFTCQ